MIIDPTTLTQHLSEAVLDAIRAGNAMNCGAPAHVMGRHEEMLKGIDKKLDAIAEELKDGKTRFESQNIRLTKLETEKKTVTTYTVMLVGWFLTAVGIWWKK